MLFTERFNEVLKISHVNQTELAARVGVSKQAITNLKNGTSLPSLDLLCALCRALGVSSDYLLGLSDY